MAHVDLTDHLDPLDHVDLEEARVSQEWMEHRDSEVGLGKTVLWDATGFPEAPDGRDHPVPLA